MNFLFCDWSPFPPFFNGLSIPHLVFLYFTLFCSWYLCPCQDYTFHFSVCTLSSRVFVAVTCLWKFPHVLCHWHVLSFTRNFMKFAGFKKKQLLTMNFVFITVSEYGMLATQYALPQRSQLCTCSVMLMQKVLVHYFLVVLEYSGRVSPSVPFSESTTLLWHSHGAYSKLQ